MCDLPARLPRPRPQKDGFPREDNAEFLGYGLVHVALDRSLRYGHFPTEIVNLGPLEKLVEIYRASFVLHEQESGTVHVDLHVVPPKPDRPCFTVLRMHRRAQSRKSARSSKIDFRYNVLHRTEIEREGTLVLFAQKEA